MYEPLFGLRKRPFPAIPQADSYFPGEAIEAARTTLVRCIRRAEGAGLVIGPSGTGKTTLCHILARELGEQLRVVFLASGRLGSRRALLQAILYELGQPYRGMDEGEARLALADYITLSDECPNGILLLVDEAHTLPLRLLDEVRMATNLAHNGKPWVRVVLVGGCALEERFASPKLDSFSQRITARCYLESLGAAETQQYIWTQIAMAGGRGEALYPELACKAVYRATDGVPRLINQVCDHALLLACAAGQRTISPGHVEEAWADLQQLPTPWNGEAAQDGGASGVIEFGHLDDEDESPSPTREESPNTIPVLRISSADEFADGEAEIEGRVERLEQMLDQAESEDAEFQPAGSIGPEVELHFSAKWNPFSEEFAEEEIVDDRKGQRDQLVPPVLEAAPFAATADVPATRSAADEQSFRELEDAFELDSAPTEAVSWQPAMAEPCGGSQDQPSDVVEADDDEDVQLPAAAIAEPATVPAAAPAAEPAAA
ncbi:MAG: AAA family ATPase, partial [Patescibacteria group bacterium]|nr:AAA family ATPase [Patescibacteria group bacterium]